mgnify:FL=1
MIPVLTKEDGTIKEIEVKKNSTCNRDVTMNLYLELPQDPKKQLKLLNQYVIHTKMKKSTCLPVVAMELVLRL